MPSARQSRLPSPYGDRDQSVNQRHFCDDRLVKYADPPKRLCFLLSQLPQAPKSLLSVHDHDGD
jgi:hypothetical protein